MFSSLCTDADVSCNKSQEDDNGWDFLVQFPPVHLPNEPLDFQPAEHLAFVQVKSTRGRRPSCRIKVSNAGRMAKATQPFFIVFVQLGSAGQRKRIFVRHVWRDLISDFLRAERLADSTGDLATHRRYITVAFSDADEAQDPVAAIAAHLEKGGKTYAQDKKQLVDTVGFEDGYGTAELTVELEHEDDMLDIQLGLIESVKITSLTHTPERFNIPAGQPRITAKDGKLSLLSEPKPGRLRLCSTKGEELIVPAQVFIAHLPDLPAQQQKTRVLAGCLDLVFKGDKNAQVRASLKPAQILPLATIEMFGTLLRWRKDGQVDLMLELDGKQIDLSAISMSDQPAGVDGWQKIGNAASLLRRVSESAMAGDVELTVHDINGAAADLDVFACLAGDNTSRFLFNPVPGAPEQYASMIGHMSLTVGGWSFAAVAQRPMIEDVLHEGRRRLTFGAARLLAAATERGNAPRAADLARGKYEQALTRMSCRAAVFEVGELREFYERTRAPM